eukprot:NODE_31_length_37178_cov_0.413576.p12 type:complete len:296 gc:universal NODE_31_length_37178_cov_0.413576:31074-30187(-)
MVDYLLRLLEFCDMETAVSFCRGVLSEYRCILSEKDAQVYINIIWEIIENIEAKDQEMNVGNLPKFLQNFKPMRYRTRNIKMAYKQIKYRLCKAVSDYTETALTTANKSQKNFSTAETSISSKRRSDRSLINRKIESETGGKTERIPTGANKSSMKNRDLSSVPYILSKGTSDSRICSKKPNAKYGKSVLMMESFVDPKIEKSFDLNDIRARYFLTIANVSEYLGKRFPNDDNYLQIRSEFQQNMIKSGLSVKFMLHVERKVACLFPFLASKSDEIIMRTLTEIVNDVFSLESVS